jgi:hypothetical protein
MVGTARARTLTPCSPDMDRNLGATHANGPECLFQPRRSSVLGVIAEAGSPPPAWFVADRRQREADAAPLNVPDHLNCDLCH